MSPFRQVVPSLLALAFAASVAASQDQTQENKPAQTRQEQPPAQEPQKPAPVQPEPERIRIIASPIKGEDVFLSPYNVDVITREEVQLERQSRTTPEVLKEIPGITVQKTAHGHGSPFIRGFTGFRNVFVIDGIRLNNSVFREGPNQYWNTVDPYLIARMEVLRGPASVLYGSDAIGGTVAVWSPEPTFEPGFHIHERTLARWSYGEDSVVARQEFFGNSDDLGFIGGVSWKDFGDIRGGEHVGRQSETGYDDEYDADLKFVYRLTGTSKLIVAHQHTRQDDVPRTHQTVFYNSWQSTPVRTDRVHKFDQERDLFYIQYHVEQAGAFFDAAKFSLSWHRQAEQFRRTQASGAQEHRDFEVDALGFFAQLGSESRIGYLTYGVEAYRELVDSNGKNISAAGVETEFTRGDVADNATYDTVGIYLQDEVEVAPGVTVIPGLRFNYVAFDSEQNSFPTGPASGIGELDDSWTALVGSLRATWQLSDHWMLLGGVSMGFRAPNLDDLTAFRVTGPGTDLPSPGLDPERAIQYELGARGRYDWIEGGAFVFYTDLTDLIRRVDTDPGPGTAFQKQNFSDGYTYGTEAYAAVRLTEEWSLRGDFSWVLGQADALVGGVKTERPLDKVNPATGHLALRFKPKDAPYWTELVWTLVRHQDRHGPADTTDNRIPPNPNEGTPGFGILTVRGGYRISENLLVTAAVENIFNKDYRYHGSGQNEPGTNLILGAEVRY